MGTTTEECAWYTNVELSSKVTVFVEVDHQVRRVVHSGKEIVVVLLSGIGGQIIVHPGSAVTTGFSSLQMEESMEISQEVLSDEEFEPDVSLEV